jgi:hypothetical protein
MHNYLTQFGIVFTPEQVKVLSDAFDDAWKHLQTSGAPYSALEYAEAARAHLARYIISTARHGNFDRQKLTKDALVYLSHRKLNRKPPHLTLL